MDVVIAPVLGSLNALLRQFPSDRYYVDRDAALQAYGSEGMFNVVDFATGWKVDFIIRKSRPFSVEEFDRRREEELDGVSVFVARAEEGIRGSAGDFPIVGMSPKVPACCLTRHRGGAGSGRRLCDSL